MLAQDAGENLSKTLHIFLLYFKNLNQEPDQKHNSHWNDQCNGEPFYEMLLEKLCLFSLPDEVSERI